MPTDPLRLRALTQTAIEEATAKYNAGGSRQAWEAEMKSAIGRGHIAAFLAGTSERLKVPLDSPLLSQARLSKAERADIKDAVRPQLEYLKGFADGLEGMSPEAVLARANLYAGATRATYYQNVTEADLPAYPGDGSSECMGNCGCSWESVEGGYTWVRGKSDSCATCVQRAGDWAPYKGDGGDAKPDAPQDAAATEEPAVITSREYPDDHPLSKRFGENSGAYREFTDPSQADSAFGEQAYRSWEQALSPEERDAVRGYQQQTFALVNDTLRGHRPEDDKTPYANDQTALLDSSLSTARVPYNVTVYRGMANPNVGVGDEFVDKGFSSTTMAPNVAVSRAKGLGDQGVVTRILVPKGTSGAYVETVTPIDQAELLLRRGTRFRVVGEGTRNLGGTEVHVIDLEVIDD